MLPFHCHQRVRVAEQAGLTTVRGVAADLAAAAGLGEQAAGRVQLVVSELATNLLRHATDGGMVLLRALEPPGGVECLALDQGPGIADLGLALADRKVVEPVVGEGLGYGLGAVRRLSDLFDIHSTPGVGTAVLSRILAAAGRAADRVSLDHAALGHLAFDWGAAMLPILGGDHCGDGFMVRADGLVVVADGLGHGEPASLAARRVEEVARHAGPDPDPQAVLAAVHEALRGTRGAAVAVVRATPGRIDYAGVGNIAATVVRGNSPAALPERWGVVGYNAAPPKTMSVAWEPGDHVLLCSDGCSRIADLFVERRLRYVAPALAAAVLLRDGTGRVDDQTIVVLRHAHPDLAATASPRFQ